MLLFPAFHKAILSPDWTVFILAKSLSAIVYCYSWDIKVSAIAKARNSVEKYSLFRYQSCLFLEHMSWPCLCLFVLALPLAGSSSLPFDKCSSFPSGAHRSLPVWSSVAALLVLEWHSCLFIELSLPVRVHWEPGLINVHIGFYGAEKGNLECRSCQMMCWLFLLTLEGILHARASVIWHAEWNDSTWCGTRCLSYVLKVKARRHTSSLLT